MMTNPSKIEIDGNDQIIGLCQFGADRGMEGTTFTDIVARLLYEHSQLSKIATSDTFFCNDGENGLEYFTTLKDAKEAAAVHLDYYRDRVADGHHVESDGDFARLCYGVVVGQADYDVITTVNEQHHKDEEYTEYDVGTEILNLTLESKGQTVPTLQD